MFRCALIISLFTVFSFVSFAEAQDTPAIANVAAIEGTVEIQRDSERIPAEIGAPLYQKDVLTTSTDSRAHIYFIDETEITLGADARLDIQDYRFQKDSADNYAHFAVTEGAFLFATGMLNKTPGTELKVDIPYGTIGVKGTTFWGGMINEEYGVLVMDGEITVATGRGRIRVEENQGTNIRNERSIPSRAAVWSQPKIDAALETVALENVDAVKQQVMKVKGQTDAPATIPASAPKVETVAPKVEVEADAKTITVSEPPPAAPIEETEELIAEDAEVRTEEAGTPRGPDAAFTEADVIAEDTKVEQTKTVIETTEEPVPSKLQDQLKNLRKGENTAHTQEIMEMEHLKDDGDWTTVPSTPNKGL